MDNNVIKAKAIQTKESVDEPNESNILKRSYHRSTFLVQRHNEIEQTICQQASNNPVLLQNLLIDHIKHTGLRGQCHDEG